MLLRLSVKHQPGRSRPSLPDSWLAHHSFLPTVFPRLKCSCAVCICVYSTRRNDFICVCVCFSEELWPISAAIICTFSPRLVTWKLHMLLSFDWWPSGCQYGFRECSFILTASSKSAIYTVLCVTKLTVTELQDSFIF